MSQSPRSLRKLGAPLVLLSLVGCTSLPLGFLYKPVEERTDAELQATVALPLTVCPDWRAAQNCADGSQLACELRDRCPERKQNDERQRRQALEEIERRDTADSRRNRRNNP